MKSLLLLDSDVVIFLHEIQLWESIIKNCDVHVASTVIGEVKFYIDKNEERIPIDLRASVSSGSIKELSVSAQQIKDVFNILQDAPPLDGIHAGELESIAILYCNKYEGLKIGIEDGLAIMALSYLELDHKAVSLRTLLKNCGINPDSHPCKTQSSDKRFRKLITDGKFLLLQYPPQ